MTDDELLLVFRPYLLACLTADPREEAKACLPILEEATMFAYPTQFPLDEASTLAGLLRGAGLQTAEDVRCAWVVTGYGLAQALPVTARTGSTPPAPAVPVSTNAQVAAHLEALCQAPAAHRSAAAVPWGQIISVLLALVQSWLAGKGGVGP